MKLRQTTAEDWETLFHFQLDAEANRMAAFTSINPSDKNAYMGKWTRLLTDRTVHMRTILYDGVIAGSIAKYMMNEKPQVTYWIGKAFWGQGIATQALRMFLQLEPTRPIYASAASDNAASIRVLEKCGFEKIGASNEYANARKQVITEILYMLT